MDDHDDTPRPAPPEWIEALERARADVAAGRTVPGEQVLAELRASIARMEARRAGKTTNAA